MWLTRLTQRNIPTSNEWLGSKEKRNYKVQGERHPIRPGWRADNSIACLFHAMVGLIRCPNKFSRYQLKKAIKTCLRDIKNIEDGINELFKVVS